MSPIAYCMHPDTDIISCAFKFDDGPTEVVFGEKEVIAYAREIDWSQYWVVGHNLSGFDAMILSWRMGIKPKLWGCTLAMSRPIHAKDAGGSLKALVEHYGLGEKDQSALIATKGKRLKDFTAQEIADMRKYNAADTDQCYQLLRRLIPQTRRDEVKLIDMTIRMLVEPQFEADIDLLANTYTEESVRKEQVLRELGAMMWNDPATRAALRIIDGFDPSDIDAVKKTLMSAARFKSLLESLGVEVPMKVSPTTGKEIPALSKTDEEFIAMQEHEDERVAAAAAARLDAKSTLLQTRINAFLDAANAHPQKKVPIPLKYYGADTTGRWSGWGYNPQNLPRINPYDPKPSDALRKSLRAPEGHKVVVADLSGIELRVNHFLWQVPSSMAMYRADPEKADLYRDFASKLYSTEFEEVSKEQRQVGKVAHLGLGFSAGPVTFQKVAKLMGGVDITLDEAGDVVDKWRSEYAEIARGWRTCHNALPTIMRGETGAAIDPWGMITPCPEGLKTPKGMIRYPDLRTERNDDGKMEFVYGHGRNKARIYAGKIDENIVQHLARCVIADNAIEIQKQTGYRPALTVHDELVYVAPEDEAEQLLDNVQQVMRTPPHWWPELVTWSEGAIADTYGDAK
jgi:DNA polymerase